MGTPTPVFTLGPGPWASITTEFKAMGVARAAFQVGQHRGISMEQHYGRLQAVSTREIWAQLGCEQPDSGSVEGGQAYPHGALARLSGDMWPPGSIYMAARALREDVSLVWARHSTRLLWLLHRGDAAKASVPIGAPRSRLRSCLCGQC